ncbi:MAG: histidinol-phosphatase [bacterium]|nr:histidinol-phosphatase [bacterium]
MILVDLHTHPTPWMNGPGAFRSFAEMAASRGIAILGFSEHGPAESGNPRYRGLDAGELDRYFDAAQQVREEFKGTLQIFCGLELDFLPERLESYWKLSESIPFDYFLASVHQIDDWHVDDANSLKTSKHRHKSQEQLYRLYYDQVAAAAESRLFDGIAHIDYLRRTLPHPVQTPPQFALDLFTELSERISRSHVVVEVNSRGLRVEAMQEIHPSRPFLKALVRAGVRFTTGSDAHKDIRIGEGLREARSILRQEGVTEICYIKRHQVLEVGV